MRKIRFRYESQDNHQLEVEEGGKWKKAQKVGSLHLTQVTLKNGYVTGYTVKSPVQFYTSVLRFDSLKKSFTKDEAPVQSVSALTVQGKKLFV
jgi:hypothetical protein